MTERKYLPDETSKKTHQKLYKQVIVDCSDHGSFQGAKHSSAKSETSHSNILRKKNRKKNTTKKLFSLNFFSL